MHPLVPGKRPLDPVARHRGQILHVVHSPVQVLLLVHALGPLPPQMLRQFLVLKEPGQPAPGDGSVVLVSDDGHIRGRLAQAESIAQLGHAVFGIRRLGGLVACRAGVGRHLQIDNLARPVRLGLVEDGLVERDGAAEVGVRSAVQTISESVMILPGRLEIFSIFTGPYERDQVIIARGLNGSLKHRGRMGKGTKVG